MLDTLLRRESFCFDQSSTETEETLEFLTNVIEIIKIFDTIDLNPNLPLQKPVVLPTVPWEPLCHSSLNKKSWQVWTEKKKKNDPTE